MTSARILIEFLGGDWDGKTLDSQSPDEEERELLWGCYDMTGQGTVGGAFHGVSMSQLEGSLKGERSLRNIKLERGSHKYTVVERVEEGNEILVRLKYSVEERPKRKGHPEAEG